MAKMVWAAFVMI